MFSYCNNNPVNLSDLCGNQPTEAVDSDGDGEPDYYTYEYAYTYIAVLPDPHDLSSFISYEVAVRGTVYVFTRMTKENFMKMKPPEGFDKYCDLMVLDLTTEKNATMLAYQAQHISPRSYRPIIKCLQAYDDDFNTRWGRSDDSLICEWYSHLVFSPFDKSAQDIDFDNKEEDFNFFDYCEKAWIRFTKKYF